MNDIPLIIAHRGASGHAPENTLTAFKLAIASAADGVEFDVRLSKDEIPVVIHDATLLRTAGLRMQVADLSAAELKALDAVSWFNKTHFVGDRDRSEIEGVPTLDDVLDLYTDQIGPIYVELKCNISEALKLVERVCEMLKGHRIIDRIIVKSFCLDAIRLVRRALPEVQTAALFEPTTSTVITKRAGIIDAARAVGAHQLSLHYTLATKRMVELANEAEMPLTVWTVNSTKWLNKAVKRNIKAVITNFPAELVKYKDENFV